jgi:D-threo-aldose 1-dehydrogenase
MSIPKPNLSDRYWLLSNTGLRLPPILLGTSALGNVGRVMTDQAKIALCGEFLQQVAPPVWLEVSYADGDGMAIEVLGRALRRLDVSGAEVAIQLALDTRTFDAADAAGTSRTDSIAECWDKCCRLLGEEFRPKLVSIEDADEESWRVLGELKAAGEVRGIGIATADWRGAAERVAALAPDWVMLRGYTVMRHSAEMISCLTGLAAQPVPVVLRGVFEGGFLVGSSRLDGRVLHSEDAADRSILAWRKGFVALCDGHGITPAHACIEFALAGPGVVAVRLETSYADRVVQNVQSVAQNVPANLWQSMKEEGLLGEG